LRSYGSRRRSGTKSGTRGRSRIGSMSRCRNRSRSGGRAENGVDGGRKRAWGKNRPAITPSIVFFPSERGPGRRGIRILHEQSMTNNRRRFRRRRSKHRGLAPDTPGLIMHGN